VRGPLKTRGYMTALAAGTVLATAGVALPLAVRATPPSKLSVDVLASGSLPSGKQYKTVRSQIEVDRLTIRPGGDSGWHAHDGTVLLLVKQGTLTNYLAHGSTCTRSRLTAGHTYVEVAGRAHLARNEGARTLVFYAVNNFGKGGTGSMDAKRPAGCRA
jgi:quercetin dioxygenase-like cupin family protein